MIIGVIEIGSGTTRLQVADIYDDGTFRPRRVPKPNKYEVDLKMALDSGQASLLKTSMDELERGLRSLKEKAEAAGARRIGCFGTEAVRQINDKKLFDFNRLSSRLELPIHVLPSGGEAKLAFWAIAREPTLRVKSGENLVVVDLGNASTDIAVGSLKGFAPDISKSIAIDKGRRTLIREFRSRENDQDAEVFYSANRKFFESKEIPVAAKTSRVVLVGGVATKHAWLKVRTDELETYDTDPKRVDGVTLSVDELVTRAHQVLEMARLDAEKARIFVDPRSPPGNYDEVTAVIAGGLFVACLLARLEKKVCTTSSQTARFGFLHMMAHEHLNRLS